MEFGILVTALAASAIRVRTYKLAHEDASWPVAARACAEDARVKLVRFQAEQLAPAARRTWRCAAEAYSTHAAPTVQHLTTAFSDSYPQFAAHLSSAAGAVGSAAAPGMARIGALLGGAELVRARDEPIWSTGFEFTNEERCGDEDGGEEDDETLSGPSRAPQLTDTSPADEDDGVRVVEGVAPRVARGHSAFFPPLPEDTEL